MSARSLNTAPQPPICGARGEQEAVYLIFTVFKGGQHM